MHLLEPDHVRQLYVFLKRKNYKLLHCKLRISLLYEHIVCELLMYDLVQIFGDTDHTDEVCYYHVSPGCVLAKDYIHQMFFHSVDNVFEHISSEVLQFEVPEK